MGVARKKSTETVLLKCLPEQPEVVYIGKYNDRHEIHEKSLLAKNDNMNEGHILIRTLYKNC